jgi:hypothetical protein
MTDKTKTAQAKPAETKAIEAEAQKQGYITREMKLEEARADQARIVAEIEAMSAMPCTPTQEELNQAMANATQAAPPIDDEAGA